MCLAEYQTQFMNQLFNNDSNNELFSGDHQQTLQRLQIYRNSIHGNRVAAYQRLFTCCQKIVGNDFWLQLLDDFISCTPSLATDITHSAKQLPDFIAQHHATKDLAYLADLAHLELAWHDCFHQATKPIDRNLTSLPEAVHQYGEQLQLQLAIGSQLLSSQYPVADLWQLCQQEPENDRPFLLTESNFYFILYRKHDSIIITQLDVDAWAICQQLHHKNCSLLELCANLQKLNPQGLNSEALTQLVQNNVITWSNA